MYRIQHVATSYSTGMPEDGKRKKFHFFSFQDEQKPPSKHPSTIESTDKILGPQNSIVESFKQQETRNLHKKPQVHENVDDELLEMRSKFTAEATYIFFNICLVIFNGDDDERTGSCSNWRYNVIVALSQEAKLYQIPFQYFLSTVIHSI